MQLPNFKISQEIIEFTENYIFLRDSTDKTRNTGLNILQLIILRNVKPRFRTILSIKEIPEI